jgi:hypothetical protein
MSRPTPNQKVEAFSRHKAGHHAINGHDGYECTSLVEAALDFAHAKSFGDFKQPDSEDYIWGSPIDDLDDLKPGDILQFRDYTSNIRTDSDDGSWRTNTLGRDHHSAIVTKIIHKGVAVEVLEQNVDPDHRKIFTNTIYLKNTIFHANKSSVTHVTVDGKIWAYRPQAK